MTCDAVFGDEGSDRRIGMFGKEHVVAYTEADDDVHVSPGLVQEPCLGNGIAGRLEGQWPHLVFLRNPEFELVDAPAFAAYRKRCETLGREDATEALCLIEQAYAGGDADLSVSHEFGKGDGIFYPRPACADCRASRLMLVAETFHPRCDLGHLCVCAVSFITIKAFLNHVHMFLRGTVSRFRRLFIRVGAPAVCFTIFLPDSSAAAATEFRHGMASLFFLPVSYYTSDRLAESSDSGAQSCRKGLSNAYLLLYPAMLQWLMMRSDGMYSIPPHLLNEAYDDRYFDVVNAIEEARHVFFHGSGLLDTLSAMGPERKEFRIGETGFGAGRLLLALLDFLDKSTVRDFVITYSSAELHPISSERMASMLEGFRPQVGPLIDMLVHAYSSLEIARPGWHHLQFIRPFGALNLELWVGEALDMVNALSMPCDAWFLDGHGPKKNPSIWRPELLLAIGAKTVAGGAVATYTVARAVSRGLSDAGFVVEQRPGFGGKKAALRGIKRQG
jgi:tRNA U34 5-methylaminomethyl-2-thiouridine-forming methyltransferase MnmC